MNMKKTHLILFVLFSFSLLFSLPDKVNAEFRAANGNGNIDIVCGSSGCGSDSNKLQLVGYSGNLGISVYSRPFNFIRSDNRGALNYGNNIPVETKLYFSPYGNAWGSWWVSGGGYDTPSMGSGEHLISEARTKDGNGRINVKAPINSYPISIVGRGAVSCNGWECTANKTGKAWIDVIFPGSSVEATSAPKYPDQDSRCKETKRVCTEISSGVSRYGIEDATCTYADCNGRRGCYSKTPTRCSCPDGKDFYSSTMPVQKPGNLGGDAYQTRYLCRPKPQTREVCEDVQVSGDDCGQDSERISYSDQNITINFNVIAKPNQAPTVDYTNTTNISYNTAKANWTYTDPERDKAKSSLVQIATDQAFTNLVFNQSQQNSFTSMNLSGLRPGTTYYPRVAAEDAKGADSAWNNGPAFTTLANPTPNPADFSCGVSKITDSPAKYTTAKVNWNYTGSDSDRLILTLRYKKVSSNLFTSNNLTSSKTGTIDQSGLEAGSTYNVQISITDEFNRHITSQIKNCGDITLDSYPNPTVNFSLSNNNGTKTAQKGGQLTINPNEGVKALWNITDTFKLVNNGCSIKTTDNGNNPKRTDKIFDRSSLGFNNSISGNIPQNISKDLKYRINLTCNGKQGFGGINESINLVLSPTTTTTCPPGGCTNPTTTTCTTPGGCTTPTTTTCTTPGGCNNIPPKQNPDPTPTVSCSLNKRSVSSSASSVELTANVANVSGYTWEAGPDINKKDTNPQSGNSPINNPLTLQYANLGFGKYTPWVDITYNGTTISATCPTITNFGSSTIREVNP